MSEFLSRCQQLLGARAVLLGEDVYARPDHWRGGHTLAKAVLLPNSTEQVAGILKLCHACNQTVVVQGGKTGLVGGAIARTKDVAISMERMNHIEELDINCRTMRVQAGVTLQGIQEQALDKGLQFPLDLGARGSATIGGNISTNAGGNRVLRYGMTRNLVLGLEAVLADGSVISSLNKVLKNNAAYDLKQLFIGSEGTLGVVTRAVLRLSPAFRSENTALLAVQEYDQLISLLRLCDAEFGGTLSSFEVMWNNYFRFTTADNAVGKKAPMSRDYPYYVLVETQGADQHCDAELFHKVLGNLMEQNLIVDAVIARSGRERDALWAIRDNVEAMHVLGPVFYFDISLPIDQVGIYLETAIPDLKREWPDMHYGVFGHLGDGNIHIVAGIGSDDPEQRLRFDDILYRNLSRHGGSISGEHGIGTEKKPFLHYSRDEAEIALMRSLKHTLDPSGILNPGKVF